MNGDVFTCSYQSRMAELTYTRDMVKDKTRKEPINSQDKTKWNENCLKEEEMTNSRLLTIQWTKLWDSCKPVVP